MATSGLELDTGKANYPHLASCVSMFQISFVVLPFLGLQSLVFVPVSDKLFNMYRE